MLCLGIVLACAGSPRPSQMGVSHLSSETVQRQAPSATSASQTGPDELQPDQPRQVRPLNVSASSESGNLSPAVEVLSNGSTWCSA